MFHALHPHVSRPWCIAVVLIGIVATLATLPTTAAAEEQLEEIRGQLSEAQERQIEVQERIESNQRELEELLGRIAGLEDEVADLEREVAGHERNMRELDAMVSFRVREAYKHGASMDPMSVLLSGDDASSALAMASTVQRLVDGDRVRTEDLAAARVRTRTAAELLEERVEDLRVAEEDFERVGQELTADLESLQELEQDLTEQERAEVARIERERREREERERREREAREAREADARAAREREAAQQRAAAQESSSSNGGGSNTTSSTESSPAPSSPAPTGGGGMACPLDQPRHFIDSWGFARSGGRAHRGTDIMGPHGIPVRAITDGTWHHQRVGANAGVWGILRGNNGDHYWYLHLTAHTVGNGARVSAGQQIGTNGSTGNAHPSAPHVHFELHPGGGSAVNPYRLLRNACG